MAIKWIKLVAIGAALGAGLTVQSAYALDWMDNSVFLNYGANYKFPGTRFDTVPGSTENYRTRNVPVTTLGFQHASGYKLGSNFLNVEWIMSKGGNDPKDGNFGSGGADEVYAVYRHSFSLSALSGGKLGGGFVRDYGLDLGFNWGRKNNAVNARPFDLLIGPSISFDVPGFWNVNLLAYKEKNNNRFNNPQTQNFKTTWQLGSAWDIDAGPGKFKGFASVTGPKGKDTSGVDTRTETLIETFYMFDVGQMAGAKKGMINAGFGVQYWKNKYGAYDTALQESTGIQNFIVSKTTATPLLRAEIHF